MIKNCGRCREKIEGNPIFILTLKMLSTIGYIEEEFCSKKCLREFVNTKSLWERLIGKVKAL